ncbi:hypothetical protein HYC85_008309 [Camellia sinensis]|uniref:Protein kinase domain-containing protein n=1 Tax=Camellia sinensis TaxID=4442 RepID=A0A7J7HRG5_CAMSI|nr:hypothetical protein HYC85_008309 [Camellia sinensis]
MSGKSCIYVDRFDDAVAAAQRAARLDLSSKEVNMVGLDHDPYNSVLLCNRATCRSKLGQFEKAIKDWTAALNVRPSYRKARLRRVNCYAKVMPSKTKIYIVLEYVGEGELFDKIPENLLLDSFGVLKVSDFGLSAFSQQVQVSIMCSLLKVMMVQQLMYGLVGSFCLFLWLDTYLLTSRTTWL